MDCVHQREDHGKRILWLAEPGRGEDFVLVLMPGGPGRDQAETEPHDSAQGEHRADPRIEQQQGKDQQRVIDPGIGHEGQGEGEPGEGERTEAEAQQEAVGWFVSLRFCSMVDLMFRHCASLLGDDIVRVSSI